MYKRFGNFPSNKHVKFDSSDDDSDDDALTKRSNTINNYNHNQNNNNNLHNNKNHNNTNNLNKFSANQNLDVENENTFLEIFNVTLAKNKFKKENSFGFEIKGERAKPGEHLIDCVEANTAADRAGLEPNDKLLKVNGLDVTHLLVDDLFKLIERETKLNCVKLNFTIGRKKPLQNSLKRTLDKDSRISYDNGDVVELDEDDTYLEDFSTSNMGKKKQKNQPPSTATNPLIKRVDNYLSAMSNDISDDMSDFMPAVDLEKTHTQMFNQPTRQLSKPVGSVQKTSSSSKAAGANVAKSVINVISDDDDDVIPVKTLEQIRAEKVDKITYMATKYPCKRPKVPSKMILNVKCREIQKRLSEQGKYVNWQEVIYELLQGYEDCQQIGDLGLSKVDDLEAINELLRLQSRIDTFIVASEARLPFLTLRDIEKAIVSNYNHGLTSRMLSNGTSVTQSSVNNMAKISKFEELYVGPLIKNRLIRKVFKIPDEVTSDRQLNPINGHQLINELHTFLNDSTAWGKKIKESDVEQYLLGKYKVKSLSMLGIKINNVNSLISTVKSVQHLHSQALKDIRSSLDRDFRLTFENEKVWLLRQFGEKSDVYKSHLAYMRANSIDVVENLLGLFMKLLDKNEYDYICDFLSIIKESVYLRDCFQLAICLGKHDLDLCIEQIETDRHVNEDSFLNKYQALLKRLFFMIIDSQPKISTRVLKKFLGKYLSDNSLKLVPIGYKHLNDDDTNQSSSNRESVTSDEIQQESDEITASSHKYDQYNQTLIDFITTRLERNCSIDYELLMRIEQAVFGSDNMKFIELLYKNRQLFEQANINIHLGGQNSQSDQVGRKLNDFEVWLLMCYLNQLIASLKQTHLSDEEKKRLLERLLCENYGVDSIEQMGLGSLNNLMESLNNPRRPVHDSFIVHEDSLVIDSRASSIEGDNEVDLTAKRAALVKSIDDCPLLDDLYEHLNWPTSEYSSVFGKDLRKVLAELQRENFRVDVLQVDTGRRLLKLTNNTDMEMLKASIEQGDYINASGHLISLIALKYRGLANAPKSLLINEIQSSLSVFLNKCQQRNNDPRDEYVNSIYGQYLSGLESNRMQNAGNTLNYRFFSFVREFVYRMPMSILKQTLFPFVLDPLVKLNSDNHDIKQELFEFVVIDSALPTDRRVKFFIRLGEACSIDEWSTSTVERIQTVAATVFKNKNLAAYEPRKQTQKDEIVKREEPESTVQDNIQPESVEENESAAGQSEKTATHSSPIEHTNESGHIESIRKRYGIGVELNEQSKSVADSLMGVIGRSLESLSNELYNKDMHFVLELIQNADDNKYVNLSGSQQPTLIFVLESEQISLLNNEVGFTAENINAICDVKASTKGKHQRGYIGRKGIGFKSVFTITDRPEIHSNGYHLSFNIENGHIGYILPNWIDDSSKLKNVEQLKQIAVENSSKASLAVEQVGDLNTCIQLPLKSQSEMQRHKSSLLTNNFNDIKPNLLLFLNRLRNLVIVRRNDDRAGDFVYQREDIDENLIQLKASQVDKTKGDVRTFVHRWLVVRDTLQVPDNLKPSENVESTDLCLAFPIDGGAERAVSSLPKLDVFAYLPLRSFGFRFIIQADFVVPASRQDINQDSSWNQWLIKHLPQLFVKAISIFQNKFDKFEALRTYLRFIPLEEEIVGCFQQIPRQIIDLLKNEEFLPAIEMSEHSEEETLVWKRPFECVVVPRNDAFLRQVLTADLLKKYLGRFYLHHDLLDSAEQNPKLFTQLGVHQLNLNDIINILKSALHTEDFNDVKKTAKWLSVLQHCLNGSYSLQQEEKFLKQLKQLDFIPVTVYDYKLAARVKQFVSLDKCTVFFPLSSPLQKVDQRTGEKVNNSNDKPVKSMLIRDKLYTIIENDLYLLDTESLLCLDELRNAQIMTVLKLLGVRLIEPDEIIEQHILANFANSAKNEQTLIAYLIFIFQYSTSIHLSFDKLKECVLLKTNRGFKSLKKNKEDLTANDCIYTLPSYGNRYDLKHMFPRYDWLFIDEAYLQISNELIKTNSKIAEMWHRFLINLGLCDWVIPQVKTVCLKRENLSSSAYSAYVNDLEPIESDQTYLFHDYECSLFDFYMNHVESNQIDVASQDLVQELSNLYRLIEDSWTDVNSRKFKYVSVYTVYDVDNHNHLRPKCVREKLCESKFYTRMKSAAWICAEVNKYVITVDRAELIRQIHLKKPCEVFIKEKVFVRFYDLHVPYALNTPVRDKSSLVGDLNFKGEFNPNEFIDQFTDWTKREKFCATLSQMKNIYLFIENCINSCEERLSSSRERLCQMIKDKKSIIFVPNELDNDADRPVVGSFYSSNQVFWHDPTQLFSKYKCTSLNRVPVLVEPFYAQGDKLQNFFIRELAVSETPILCDYVDLLQHVCFLSATNKSPFTYEQTLKDVFTLYELFVDKCVESSALESLRNKDLPKITHADLQITESMRDYMLRLFEGKQVFPCFKGKWMTLADWPILVDNDFDLAEKFLDKINIVVANTNSRHTEFYDYCRLDEAAHPKLHFFYVNILGLQIFSKVILLNLENITDQLREAPQVQNICRKLLPYVQCYMYHRDEFKAVYEELNGEHIHIGQKLQELKFYSVKELQNIYKFTHDASVYATVSNKTCIDTKQKSTYWKYYVRYDLLDNLKEIIKGFVKLFTRNEVMNGSISEKAEKEFVNYCLLMQPFVDYKLKDDDRRDIEREHMIKLHLPDSEPQWLIKEANVYGPKPLDQEEIMPEDTYQNRRNFNKNQDQSGLSKRKELLESEEKLSRDQLNVPQDQVPVQEMMVAHQNAAASGYLNISNRSHQNLDKNLQELVEKMTNFKYQQAEILPPTSMISSTDDEYSTYCVNWSESLLGKLEQLKSFVSSSATIDERNKEFLFKIGRWGEMWVNEALKQKYEKELRQGELKIEWMNESVESGLPYDFRITKTDTGDNHTNTEIEFDQSQAGDRTESPDRSVVTFIEVKTTSRLEQETFPISYQELLFARNNSSKFEVYRLYNAAGDDPNSVKLKIIKNLPYLLNTHGLNLFIVI